MAGSTYSTNLKIELMTTGENSGTWGDITNTNLGTALEQAIVGYGNPDYVSDANLTISITNSNAAQAARALVLNVTSVFGSLTQTRELVVPTIQKQYIVQNNTTGGQSITVKTSAGTGITVPNGRKAHLYVDGTNVIQMFDYVDINGGSIDGTPIGASSASTGAFTTLNASGATTLDGNVTLGNASGDTVTVTGTIASNLLFTDNTYDIGASGATRPRNLYLAGAATIGGNLSVGGTLTLTGGLTLNGNVTVGDSASDTLTINSTVTSNLIFTDNTYDIGASGATRPRNLFIAGNITAGGNQTLTGSLTVDSTTDSSSTTTGSIQTDGGLGVAKAVYIGTNLNVAGNTSLGDSTSDTLSVGALVNSNLLFTDGTYAIGGAGANRPAAIILGQSSGGYTAPIVANNTASGGGGFVVNLFASSTGNAVAGDSLIYNGVGNMIFSPNVANKKLVFVTGLWTNTPTMTIDSTNVLINTQTNATASPNLYVYGGPGTLMTVGGLNHYSTGAGGNNNGFIGGGYYNTSSNTVATHTKAAQYQNYDGTHIFYTNTGLTVGNTYTNVRRASINENGVNIVGPLTTARSNFYGSITPFWQAEGSQATGLRAVSLTYNSGSSTGPLFAFLKSRGSSEGSTTAVQVSDELGQLNYLGMDGTNPVLGASITAYAEGTISTGSVPMKLSFQTGGTSGQIYQRYEISYAGSHYWKNVTSPTYGDEMTLTPTLLTTYNKKIECQSNSSAGFDAFQIYGTGYSSDQKYWRTKTQNGVLQHQTMSDNYLTERTYMYVNRSGVNVQSISLNTGSSSATRLYIQDSTGEVICGYNNSLSSDNRFAVSNNGAIGFEVAPGTVSGFSTSVRLLAYDRSVTAYRNFLYSASAHNFNVSGETYNTMTVTSGNVSVNPSNLTPNYGGLVQILRSANGAAKAIVLFQTDNPSSSEDFNINASSGTYTNSSTPGWAMQRILADRTASSVFNFLTCTANNDCKFYLRGDGNAYADGTWNNNGADYAEYFESASGQEIPVGTTVVLDGNKVRPATAQDTNILGVVRPKKDGINSMVVGNTAWGHWAGKYLQDDFGCFIMEDFTVVEWTETFDEWEKEPDPAMGTEGVKKTKRHSYVTDAIPAGVTIPADAEYKTHDSNGVKLERPQINPAWTGDEGYVPREKRAEWLIIGLLGQIRILKGQPTGSSWVKMRDISASVEEWFVK